MSKYKRVTASLFGKTATIIPTQKGIEVYTTGTWLIIASLWVFAGVGFWVSTLLNNFVLSVIITVICGVGGFLLAYKLYMGKLTNSIPYSDIQCFKYTVPEFTIIKHDNYLYTLRVLTNPSRKLLLAISEQLKDHEEYQLVAKNGGYYVETNKSDK